MKTSLISLCSHFKRAQSGATAIEFALIAPVFFLIILGLFEVGLFTYTAVALESTVARAGREASIGNLTAEGGTRAEQVQALIREGAGPLIGSENLQMDIRVIDVGSGYSQRQEPDICYEPYGVGVLPCGQYEDVNGNGVYDAQATTTGAGSAEDVVEINVRLPWRANFAMVQSLFGSDGIAVIRASTIVKNEPFDD